MGEFYQLQASSPVTSIKGKVQNMDPLHGLPIFTIPKITEVNKK